MGFSEDSVTGAGCGLRERTGNLTGIMVHRLAFDLC